MTLLLIMNSQKTNPTKMQLESNNDVTAGSRKRKRDDEDEEPKEEAKSPELGRIAKVSPYPKGDKRMRPGEEGEGLLTWLVIEALKLGLNRRMRTVASTSKFPCKNKPTQQNSLLDTEPLVTKMYDMIDDDEFVEKDKNQLRLAVHYIRESRLDFTKFDPVNLMDNAHIYVSAIVFAAGPTMLKDPALAAKAKKFLDDVNLPVLKPLPPK